VENLTYLRKPIWLKSEKVGSKRTVEITRYLKDYHLHTVCDSAKCPNKGECFERGTATFMILGNICTRNCTFCAVDKTESSLLPPDPNEPEAIAELSGKLDLKHIVITTVARDDLADGGASQFIKVINKIRETCNKNVSIEVLISDLNGNLEQLDRIINALPDVINHNIETVPRLYPTVRPMADFKRSLKILEFVKLKSKRIITKSGFMVGLGEEKNEIIEIMKELRKVKVDVLTIGQYMQPLKYHHPVIEYIHPDEFQNYKEIGLKMGFKIIESAPLVRSSYHAEKVKKLIKKQPFTKTLPVN